MSDWKDLERELDAWQEAYLQPTFWWRNDDVVKPTSSLQRALSLSERHKVPISLAVIPMHARRALKHLLADRPLVSVLQHGFSHRNYSPRGELRCELSARRPVRKMLKEIKKGRQKLLDMFPNQGLAVLVPPWGRISEEIIPDLFNAGFVGISAGGQDCPEFVQGLRQANVHIDIVDWRARSDGFAAFLSRASRKLGLSRSITHRFVGLSSALDQVIHHLSSRRTGVANVAEPTGLMTHHHAHDEDCWDFVNSFLKRTRACPSVKWLSAEELFSARS